MIENETDYLSIKILKYVPSGFNTVTINEGSNFGVGPNGLIYDPGNPLRKFTNTAGNRAKLIEFKDISTVNRRPKGVSPQGIIFLPIPSNIQDGNSVTSGAGEMDGLTAQTLGIIQKAFSSVGQGDLKDISKKISDFALDAANLALSPGAQQYFINNLAAAAANIPFGGNLTAAQILSRQTGQILNPNMELLFSGVNLRSFKFSFKMTPRNRKEVIQIRNIIRTLKKNMSPSEESTTYLDPPNVFQLEYRQGNKPHPFLHKFKECALTDMSVNYTGEGTYATYGDDLRAPVSMVMDLGFKELEPIYAGDYVDDTPENRQNKSYIEDLHGGVGY